ncbi:MAG: hypothetical protein H6709_15920 [Kofleriaceae bacterium]|nr:hypothetical protein [Myxococcales bacterium]MCB9563813.1 hypothetical protein [Kofleriaceae bacterium]MCB9573566.1 hypothetical protein [Kofleriaceae bacterium]
MSQNPKRPGSRDISELKARLGLKKGAAAGGAAQPKQRNGAGVVPPPGLNLPPPPGVKPAGQQIPDASDDPFGAMNAMAQMGAVQRAPEIVIVNDGKPVESVSTGDRMAKIGKYAAIAIVPLVLGLLIGQISKDAKNYNGGLAGAKAIHADIKGIKDRLGELKNSFESTGSIKDRKVAEELSKEIAANKEIAKNKEIVFRVKQNTFNAELSAKVMIFYSMVENIEELIVDHEASAKQEENAIKAADAAAASASPKEGDALAQGGVQYHYGLILTNPSEEEAGKGDPQAARIAEIGAPLCSGKASSSGSCPDGDVSGFLYRFGTGTWSQGDIVPPGGLAPGEAFPLKKIITLAPSDALDALVKGADGTVAQVAYFKRLMKIYDKVKEAYEYADALEKVLNKKSQESSKFTWFM